MKMLYLITGMSGAGKSTVLNSLEDSGFYCVDNLPVGLFDKFIELFDSAGESITKIAIAIDIRSGRQFHRVISSLHQLEQTESSVKTIFLECGDSKLVTRYKETRRRHPLFRGNLPDAIRRERKLLSPLKDHADTIIDTSQLKSRDLGLKILEMLNADSSDVPFQVSLMSFGFKHGIPQDADLVFDVRFMDNPFYVEGLRHKRGFDEEVSQYVFNNQNATDFIERMQEFLGFLLPMYVAEGRKQLTIALGCTGGQHRSVASVERLYENFEGHEEFVFQRYHRDCRK
jgi:UPF0042 nucleotide-binding protein